MLLEVGDVQAAATRRLATILAARRRRWTAIVAAGLLAGAVAAAALWVADPGTFRGIAVLLGMGLVLSVLTGFLPGEDGPAWYGPRRKAPPPSRAEVAPAARVLGEGGAVHVLRRWHLRYAYVEAAPDGWTLCVPDHERAEPRTDEQGRVRFGGEILRVGGAGALVLLQRIATLANARGASALDVETAVRILDAYPSPDAYLRAIPRLRRELHRGDADRWLGLPPLYLLALEIAVTREVEALLLAEHLPLLRAEYREAVRLATVLEAL